MSKIYVGVYYNIYLHCVLFYLQSNILYAKDLSFRLRKYNHALLID